MTIQFTCPHCGKQTAVANRYAGQTGPCAGCGNPITISATGLEPAPSKNPLPQQTSTAGAVVVVLALCLVGLLACGGIVAALLIPAYQSVGGPSPRSQCRNNLRRIGLALHNYHDVYGCLPPAYVTGEDGTPLYSWRVLILPFMEQQALYDQFDLTQAWNSPQNLALSNVSMPVFQCPSATGANPAKTNYVVVTGPSTAFPGDQPCRFIDFTDGLSNTTMVVEVVDTGVGWAEPADLDASKITFPLSAGSTISPGSKHDGGVHILLCDGSPQFAPNTIAPAEFNASLTRNGGERISMNY